MAAVEVASAIPAPEAAEAAVPVAAAAAAAVAAVRKESTLVWPPAHRYAREVEQLVKAFKAYAAEDPKNAAAGWTVLDTKKDVLISKKTGTTPLGLLRGDGLIEGYSPAEIYPVVSLPACRKIWDDLFDEGRPVEPLDSSTILSYAATKGQWPTSGRDLCVVLVNEFCEDGRIFTMSVSVVDSKLPAVKGRVRADLKLNGWYLEPLPGGKKGARVVYMTEIDLNGMIPGAILKLVALQVPLAIADVRKYLTRFGPPAFVHRIGGETVETPNIDHDQSRLDFKLRIDSNVAPVTVVGCNKQRYPDGVSVTVAPADAARIEWSAADAALLFHHDDPAKNGTTITVTVEPGSGSKITVNGVAIYPPATAAAAAPAAAGVAGAPAAAAVTSAAVSAVDASAQLDEVMRRLERIERAIADSRATTAKATSTSTARLGLAFLAGVPIVAFLAARYT